MVFHMRAQLGGTYLSEPDGVKRLEAKINGKVQSLVYPSWHSSGRFIAFSMNQTKQAFIRTTGTGLRCLISPPMWSSMTWNVMPF